MLSLQDIIDQLNELIQICKDGEQGYQTAAENVHNTELETMFRGYAKRRADFARELQTEVERLGGEPSQSGNMGAAMHRGWMNFKSSLSGGDPAGLIAACESAEDSALAAYDRAAHTDVTGKTRALIDKQLQQVQEAHTRLARLKGEGEDGARFPKNEGLA